jgi:hypothetical protein
MNNRLLHLLKFKIAILCHCGSAQANLQSEKSYSSRQSNLQNHEQSIENLTYSRQSASDVGIIFFVARSDAGIIT